MTAETDIKYILVEMVLDKKDKPIAELVKTSKIGLFKGLREEAINDDGTTSSFVLIKNKGDRLLTLNLNYYNILSVERFNGLSKTIHYFRAHNDDQEAAVNILEKIVQEVKLAGNMLASSDALIDTSAYTQIPMKYGDSGDSISQINSSSNGVVDKTGASIHTPSTTYIKPSNKPSIIKRTSKVPTKIILEEMEKKIEQIREGKYEAKLPDIALDPPDSELENEEDYNATYFVGG